MGNGVYHLFGHEHLPISYKDLALLVRAGALTGDTKVTRDGEGFAVALGCLAEFRRLVVRPASVPPGPIAGR